MQKENALRAVKDGLINNPEADKFYVTTDGKVHTCAIKAVGHAQQLSAGNPKVETITRAEAEKFEISALDPNVNILGTGDQLPGTGEQGTGDQLPGTGEQGTGDQLPGTGEQGTGETTTVTNVDSIKTLEELNQEQETARLYLETTKMGGDEIAIADAQKKYDDSFAAFEARMNEN